MIFKNNNKIKIFSLFGFLIFITFFLLAPRLEAQNNTSAGAKMQKAKVIEILAELEKTREDNSLFTQQNLKLEILKGENKGAQVYFYGISDLEVFSSSYYQEGDRVFIDSYLDENGEETYYVVDAVRTKALIILALIFVAILIFVGRFKGLRALISLILSFFVIVKFILPQILAGQDPFLVSLIGGLIIMTIIIYLTEGWHRKSHLAILSVFISLISILALSLIFVGLANLSGLAQEEAAFLVGVGDLQINFRGLLLAGFIIGAIGVLDDIIVGQIEATDSLREANHNLSKKNIFTLAYRVGNTHLGAIVNTLFLTYTGAALPLLLLFILNQSSGLSLERFLSTETVATEVVRTLVGSIGVMLSMPIATFFGAFYGKGKKS
ncbi:YibE/F family protein [Candidatus Falkowbacteria bacterium]|nr:YibE/F family protein [Candidatus Falkowbacteria bacterium]NCT54983.1 YibE/F family protein [Candidatus Falkowbacteria bacterium]